MAAAGFVATNPFLARRQRNRRRTSRRPAAYDARCVLNKGASLPGDGDNNSSTNDGAQDKEKEVMRLEDAEGHLDNANVRPKIDLDADETVLLIKLRRMLHEDDFKRIFDSKNRKIGEL